MRGSLVRRLADVEVHVDVIDSPGGTGWFATRTTGAFFV